MKVKIAKQQALTQNSGLNLISVPPFPLLRIDQNDVKLSIHGLMQMKWLSSQAVCVADTVDENSRQKRLVNRLRDSAFNDLKLENREFRRENQTVFRRLRLLRWLDIAAEFHFAVLQPPTPDLGRSLVFERGNTKRRTDRWAKKQC